jgi:V8-like Glu-specific endopeptidase
MKTTTLTLLMAGLSFNAFAIENGTSVSWNNYDDIVKAYNNDKSSECSGTVIAGKFVLTAAHCVADSVTTMSNVQLSPNHNVNISSFTAHTNYIPDTDDYTGYDVAVITLTQSANTKNIHFFADLTKDTVKVNDPLFLFGFGRTNLNLNYASFTMVNLNKNPADRLDGKQINASKSTGGDSGGPWLNNKQEIVSVHKASSSFTDGRTETYSTNLFYLNDFILKEINGWHYPTLANTSNGTATITVQSLHQNNVADNATTSGDAQIIGGTCLDQVINPYEKCTYIIESQGGIGTIHLSDNESIAINKPTPTPESGGGDSGGSLGFLSLIGLLGLGLIRKK